MANHSVEVALKNVAPAYCWSRAIEVAPLIVSEPALLMVKVVPELLVFMIPVSYTHLTLPTILLV